MSDGLVDDSARGGNLRGAGPAAGATRVPSRPPHERCSGLKRLASAAPSALMRDDSASGPIQGNSAPDCPPAVRAPPLPGHVDPFLQTFTPTRLLGEVSLDAVAIGVDEVRGVVAGAVVGPKPGRAIVAASGCQAGGVKTIDGVAAGGREAEMQARPGIRGDGPVRGADPQGGRLRPVAQGLRLLA